MLMKQCATKPCRHTFSTRAGKGFGTSKQTPPKQRSNKSDDLAAALSQAKKSTRQSYVRPVDEREAFRGKVDFAQVTNWGSGEDLGELEVKSFKESVLGDDTRPFYEQLARALELAQSRGLLKVAEGGEPFPPFEKWAFKPEHYAQYLEDQLAVHRALAEACSAAVQSSPAAVQLSLPPADYTTTAEQPISPPWHAAFLACFATSGPLSRASALEKDARNYASASALKNVTPSPAAFTAGGMATSYAQLITRLGRDAKSAELRNEREEAGAKLFAHAYCIHATHLTTGMRIGAAATEKLGLLSAGATNLYQDYPSGMTNPLANFVEQVNAAGASASLGLKDVIMEELPGGLLKTSLLLTALARDK